MSNNGSKNDEPTLRDVMDRLDEIEQLIVRASRPGAVLPPYVGSPRLCMKEKPPRSNVGRQTRPGWNGEEKCTKPRGHSGWCSWANRGLIGP